MENGRSEITLGERRTRHSYVSVEISYEAPRKGTNSNQDSSLPLCKSSVDDLKYDFI